MRQATGVVLPLPGSTPEESPTYLALGYAGQVTVVVPELEVGWS